MNIISKGTYIIYLIKYFLVQEPVSPATYKSYMALIYWYCSSSSVGMF